MDLDQFINYFSKLIYVYNMASVYKIGMSISAPIGPQEPSLPSSYLL